MPDELASPLVFSIEVPRPPLTAFAAYTERLGEWWDPRLTPDPDTFTDARIEPAVGGEVALVHGDQIYAFGEVLTWEPGRRFAQTFTLSLDRNYPTTVTVDFEPLDAGTRVTLTHGGWVEGNITHRDKFDEWLRLLQRYAALLS